MDAESAAGGDFGDLERCGLKKMARRLQTPRRQVGAETYTELMMKEARKIRGTQTDKLCRIFQRHLRAEILIQKVFDPMHDLRCRCCSGRESVQRFCTLFSRKVKKTQDTVELKCRFNFSPFTAVPAGAHELKPPLSFAADIKGHSRKAPAVHVFKILLSFPPEKERLDTQPFEKLEFISVGSSGRNDEKIPRPRPEFQIFPQMERHAAVKNIKQFMNRRKMSMTCVDIVILYDLECGYFDPFIKELFIDL